MTADSGNPGLPCLVIGPISPLPEITTVAVSLGAVDAALLAQIRPERVICPLFARDFDALAVASHLSAIGYRGRLTVVAPGLPKPAMVAREIMSQAPGLDVELVETL